MVVWGNSSGTLLLYITPHIRAACCSRWSQQQKHEKIRRKYGQNEGEKGGKDFSQHLLSPGLEPAPCRVSAVSATARLPHLPAPLPPNRRLNTLFP